MGAETGATAAQIEAMPAGLDPEEQLVWAVSRAVWRPYGGHTPGPRSIIALLRQSGVTIEMRQPDAVVLDAEQADDAKWACDSERMSLEQYADDLEDGGLQDAETIANVRAKAARYRALAEHLGGAGDGGS